jgi:hemerythrin-like domain-containing protein
MQKKILPIAPLMIEHRLIERVISLMQKEFEAAKQKQSINANFIGFAVDFMKTYADKCHHGKEEDIFFYELAKKNLSPELKNIMDELIQEHGISRVNVKELSAEKESYIKGDKNSLNKIFEPMKVILELYPKHIEKEDRCFFLPSMKYFSDAEKDEMLKKFFEFDKNIIHDKYKNLVEHYEKKNI